MVNQILVEQLTQIIDLQTLVEMKQLVAENYAQLRQFLPEPVYAKLVVSTIKQTVDLQTLADTVQIFV